MKKKIITIFGAFVMILLVMPSVSSSNTLLINQSDEIIIEESLDIDQDPYPLGICTLMVQSLVEYPTPWGGSIIPVNGLKIKCKNLGTGEVKYGTTRGWFAITIFRGLNYGQSYKISVEGGDESNDRVIESLPFFKFCRITIYYY